MMSAGRAPNATCAQEHNCYQTEDSRPWSLATFSNYLEDLDMLRPTKIDGAVSIGILREYSGCTLDGAWTSASAGASLSMSVYNWSANVTWGPTALLDNRYDLATKFGVFDINNDNFLSPDEFKQLSIFLAREVQRGDALPVFNFLPFDGRLLNNPVRLVSKAFFLLDADEDERLSLQELMSGIARVNLQWDASPSRSPSGEVHFTGKWTLLQGDAWSTELYYHPAQWRKLQCGEKRNIQATRASGGKAYATLDGNCMMSMRLMTETVDEIPPQQCMDAYGRSQLLWEDGLPPPQVFLDFADGQQSPSEQDIAIPIPPQVSLCISVSVCLSFCLSVSMSLFLSHSLNEQRELTANAGLVVSLCLSVCLSLSLYLSLSISLCLSVSLCLCLSLAKPPPLQVSLRGFVAAPSLNPKSDTLYPKPYLDANP